MCDVPSCAEIRQIKQIIPTKRLIRWAEAAGFEVRKSGGGSSHVVYRHKEFPDIGANIVRHSKKLATQRNFADCLGELESRRAHLAVAFTDAADSDLNEAYKKLPPHLTIEHDFENGHSIVRDRMLPQIGITIKFEDARLLENKIRFLEDAKRDAYMLLNRHDITLKPFGKNSAGRVLSHPVYEIPAVALAPYRGDTAPTTFFEQIGAFAQSVSDIDSEHAERLSKILACAFVERVSVTAQSARGTRENTLECKTPSGKGIVVEFQTHSNRRILGGNNVANGRISERALIALEDRINGLAAAHLRAA